MIHLFQKENYYCFLMCLYFSLMFVHRPFERFFTFSYFISPSFMRLLNFGDVGQKKELGEQREKREGVGILISLICQRYRLRMIYLSQTRDYVVRFFTPWNSTCGSGRVRFWISNLLIWVITFAVRVEFIC